MVSLLHLEVQRSAFNVRRSHRSFCRSTRPFGVPQDRLRRFLYFTSKFNVRRSMFDVRIDPSAVRPGPSAYLRTGFVGFFTSLRSSTFGVQCSTFALILPPVQPGPSAYLRTGFVGLKKTVPWASRPGHFFVYFATAATEAFCPSPPEITRLVMIAVAVAGL